MTTAHREEKNRRPGGRSARVQAAVFEATLAELVESGVSGFSIGAVAERSGVHATSIYRRWKTPEHLMLSAALGASTTQTPLLDSGSLRNDLISFLTVLDAHIRTPLGQALLTITSLDDPGAAEARQVFWQARLDQAKLIFERAAARGEIDAGTDLAQAVEVAVTPVYMRALILRQPDDPEKIIQHADLVLRAFMPGAASS